MTVPTNLRLGGADGCVAADINAGLAVGGVVDADGGVVRDQHDIGVAVIAMQGSDAAAGMARLADQAGVRVTELDDRGADTTTGVMA